MEFRTRLDFPPSYEKVSHKDRIFLVGSCFSQHIGARLHQAGFTVCDNPFGTVYQPLAIEKQIRMLMQQYTVREEDFIESQGNFVHPDFHSSLSASDAKSVADKINGVLHTYQPILHKSNWIFITLGTALAYVWHKTGNIVANCHKLPAGEFTRKYISIEEITSQMGSLFEELAAVQPSARIVLTVSPVRHTKEGICANARSKARLIEAAHSLTEIYPRVSYFPAYEWMTDDLRDYRFYQDDMIHPSDMAIAYIWEHFQNTFMDRQTRQLSDEATAVFRASLHRPLHSENKNFREFCQLQIRKIHQLKTTHPEVNLTEAEHHFLSHLSID